MKENYYDTVIVGAGPAGLNCAYHLSKQNKSILLLEKNNMIGPKVCAGGLLNHDLKYLKLSRSILDHKFNEILLHTPFNKTKIKIDKPFIYTIDRKNFGQWQLKKIKNTSVKIKSGSRATEIKKNSLTINRSEEIKFKHLVGADGSNSIVRKYLGLDVKKLGVGIQYIIPTKKYKQIEFFFDSNLFFWGYAWIFPHGNYASVGVSYSPKHVNSIKTNKNFKIWLKNNKIDISNGEFQTYPLNMDFQGYKFSNVFLVGDAAGLVSPFTGEGIYQALISGEEVAKIILDRTYVPEKLNEIIKTNKTHERLTDFFRESGKFRKIEYELIAFLLKSKFIAKQFVNLFSDKPNI